MGRSRLHDCVAAAGVKQLLLFLLVSLCVSATTQPEDEVLYHRLHIRDVQRYKRCPFHKLVWLASAKRAYACFTANNTKAMEILQHTPGPFLDARHFFSQPFVRGGTIFMGGDSLMRNQYVSLACLLWEADPEMNQEHMTAGNPAIAYSPTFDVQLVTTFTRFILDQRIANPSQAYNAGFDRLVLQTMDGQGHQQARVPTVVALSAGHHYAQGKFDHTCASRAGCNPHAPHMETFRIAMDRVNYMLRERIVGGSSQKFAWRGVPPRHFQKGEWDSGGSCPSTAPCTKQAMLLANNTNNGYWVAIEASRVIHESAQIFGFPFVDIIPRSLDRCDGHIGHLPIGAHGATADCSHYCVPGVPDAWNVPLLQALFPQYYPHP